MQEFTVDKTVYRAGKLDAFKQLHILRRLTPCLGHLAGISSAEVDLLKNDKADASQIVTPITNAIGALKDEDVEYILNSCLEVTERKQAGGKWAPFRVNNTTMFDGLTLPVLLQIAYHVIRENLTDFFAGLPSGSGLEGLLTKFKASLG